MSGLKLCFEGEGAAKAARELKDALQDRLGQAFALEAGPSRPPGSDKDAALALGLAAAVLAIPGAILAARDLVARFGAQDKAQVIIELSAETAAKYPGLSITVTGSSGVRLKLSDMEPVTLVDLAAEQEESR